MLSVTYWGSVVRKRSICMSWVGKDFLVSYKEFQILPGVFAQGESHLACSPAAIQGELKLCSMVTIIEWSSWLLVNSIDKIDVLVLALVSCSVLWLPCIFDLQNHILKYFSKAPSLPCTWARSFPARRLTAGIGLLLLSQPEPKYGYGSSVSVTLPSQSLTLSLQQIPSASSDDMLLFAASTSRGALFFPSA